MALSLLARQHQLLASSLSGRPCCQSAALPSRAQGSGRHSSRVAAVERDLDWEPQVSRPTTAPPRGGGPRAPPPPPPAPPKQPDFGWLEAPFRSRRNIALTMLGGAAGLWILNHKILAPLDIGQPPPDFPFSLAGYTDIAPEEFVYAKTPGGHWVAAAQDPAGRMYMIDEIGDLYYDSGDPQIGLYAMDTQGNLFNFYSDTDGSRRITPVGNVADLTKFKINEIAGIKLDRDVNVVAFKDGRAIPLPPNAGARDKDGKFVPPGELVEGIQMPQESGFSRLLGAGRDFPLDRYEVDLNDPTPFDRQLFNQTLLDDPDLPGFQPALPRDLDFEQLAREVEAEAKQKSQN